MKKLLLADETGAMIDVFQLDRYDLHTALGQSTLIEDIQSAASIAPTDWQIRPAIACELIRAIENALARLNDPYLGEDDGQRQQPEIRELTQILRKLKCISNYQVLSPDQQLADLIQEMTLTASLTEHIEELSHLAELVVERAHECCLSYDEFDDLALFLERSEIVKLPA